MNEIAHSKGNHSSIQIDSPNQKEKNHIEKDHIENDHNQKDQNKNNPQKDTAVEVHFAHGTPNVH